MSKGGKYVGGKYDLVEIELVLLRVLGQVNLGHT